MAEKLSDVLDAAKSLTSNGVFQKGDIKVKPYPGQKVRIFVVTGGKDVMIAGDAHSNDAKDAKAVVGDLITQAKVDAVLAAVAQFSATEVKPLAPAAAPSS